MSQALFCIHFAMSPYIRDGTSLAGHVHPRFALPADINGQYTVHYIAIVHVRVAFFAANLLQRLFLVTNSKFRSLYTATFLLCKQLPR